MQRFLVAVTISALAVIATFGSLAFVWAAPHSSKASQRPEGDWRILDPVTYENISIFPVVSGSSQDTSSFLTLEEGLASGEVVVSERGAVGMVRHRGEVRPIAVPQYESGASVNQLVLVNRSKRPLLLLARRTRQRRQARPHHRQRSHCARRRRAASARCFLCRARPLGRQQLAIQCIEDDRSSQRSRASRR
jgi:hypothetical protein